MSRHITVLIFGVLLFTFLSPRLRAINLPDPYSPQLQIKSVPPAAIDTLPLSDRKGDFMTDKTYNPFDINTSLLEQKVEYDPVTNKYVVYEKIGDEYYRTPTYMTFDEYLEWQSKQSEKEYFQNLNGVQSNNKKFKLGSIDPMSKIDIQKSLVDRLFGGSEINVKPQGGVDLTLGFFTYYRNTGVFATGGRTSPWNPLDPIDFKPRLTVDGGIGEKLKLNFNYDANSTFDFDRKIKLNYDANAFSEDDIVKKIEAGNVSLPLKGNLIQGNQSLMGIKTELQFGHLRMTLLASQQLSKQNNQRIQNGATINDFEIYPHEFDENRHYFLSHYNRETFEATLSNLPQINTSYRVAQLEVWISDDRPDYQIGQRNIVAISDLAEGDLSKYNNQQNPNPPLNPMPKVLMGYKDLPLPDNRSNITFERLMQFDTLSDRDKVNSILTNEFRMQQIRDFESFRGRLLNSSEYTFNPQLGTLSLNIKLRPNQVLGVAYKYYYSLNCDEVYTVGQISSAGPDASQPRTYTDPNKPNQDSTTNSKKVLFVKLLKSSNPSIKLPNYDLMMKNVYNLRTSQLNKEGFEFDVFYQDDYTDGSLKKFIPERPKIPLLNIFKLDNLNKFGDPQPDGIFDYVPGVTVIERSGSVMFPVLEPFGSSLDSILKDQDLLKKYKYQALYDSSLTNAVYTTSNAQNKFVMRGKIKSANNGEINLGPFVPKDGVTVTAGGITLIEGVDYEIDYSLGKLRVLNPAYISGATPININYEDRSAFSSLNRSMLGARFDYDFSKKFTMGATYLRLAERPFTQKVNIGDDPIKNQIFGLDLSYNEKTPWVTTMLDKLPFYSTKAESSFALSAEAAYLKPGHSRYINSTNKKAKDEGGLIIIDDFEGAISGFTLGGYNSNSWILSSTPPEFKEAKLTNDLRYGANRAKLSWYQIDQSVNNGGSTQSSQDQKSPYSRLIRMTDLLTINNTNGTNQLFSFDLTYYPFLRGPYNFDKPEGYSSYSKGTTIDADGSIRLNDPSTRWAGIMRNFPNPDFEANNYQFIEFWMLNPFMDEKGNLVKNRDAGKMVFHLGNVSEDVLRDNNQFFENAVDTTGKGQVAKTVWGKVPVNTPLVSGFELSQIKKQDLGFDGMTDSEERLLYDDWMNNYPTIKNTLQKDPSGDNFKFYNDASIKDLPMLTRMRDFNNPQGNTPSQGDFDNNRFFRGSRLPDSEDLDNDRSLDQGEAYYEYAIDIANNGSGEIDTASGTFAKYFRQTKLVGSTEKWYRVVVPITDFTSKTNIEGFRSIQFMRLYLKEFEEQKTFRLVDFQLTRNQWRLAPSICKGTDNIVNASLDEVGIYENSKRTPFNYVTPPGVKQEEITGSIGLNQRQDEKSMSMKFCNFQNNCEISLNKLARIELNLYKSLQLFTHIEASESGQKIKNGDISVFIRLSKDLGKNYYEYVMPLKASEYGSQLVDNIWPDTNKIDILLSKFTDLKKARIKDNTLTEIDDPENVGAKFIIKGVPSLGNVNFVEIGLRNTSGEDRNLCGTAWFNELRASGLNEEGAWATVAKAQLKLADLGDINAATSYSTIGFGKLDQRLLERSRDEIFQFDASTSLQLGKLLPKFLPLSIPFYAQYTRSSKKPQFDPYQRDIEVDDLLAITSGAERADVKDRAREVTTIKSYNVNNVKVEGGKGGGKPWSPENLNVSYSFNETKKIDPIIKEEVTTERKGILDYGYSGRPKYIQPLKFIKPKALKFISEFNFNLLPTSIGFNTNLEKYNGNRTFRLPSTPVFRFDDQRFKWDRNYTLDWDLAKSLRFNFKATVSSVIDELRQVGIADTPVDRDWVNARGSAASVDTANQYRLDNFKKFGRAKNYNHSISLTYKIPIHHLPLMDWVSANAEYKATYNWTTSPLIYIDELGNRPGGIVANTQLRTLNTTLSFDKLYNKWGYLKKIDQGVKAKPGTKKADDKSKDKSKDSGKGDKRSRGDSGDLTMGDPKSDGDDAKEGDKKADDKDSKGKTSRDKRAKEKSANRMPTMAERVLIRPLLTLRNAKFTYKEDLSTSIPGVVDSNLYGLIQGFKNPGWQFASGLQPDLRYTNQNNYLFTNKTWFNPSGNFNDQLSQNQRQTINLKVALEPFKDFKVDVDFNKDYKNQHTELFKAKDGGFMQIQRIDNGSFETTYSSLNTLFKGSAMNFAQFLANRPIVSHRLYELTGQSDTIVPHEDFPKKEFAKGYGPSSFEVLIPSFLAAYTKKDISTYGLSLRDDVKAYDYIPRPNWNLRYDGLSKLPWFKSWISSFSLKHGLKSTLSVSRFNTGPSFKATDPYIIDINSNGNYYSAIEIPGVLIKEEFSPLLGIDLKTKSNMEIKLEYKKGRTLDLRSTEFAETLGESFILGYGYTINNFKGFWFEKKARPKRTKKNEFDVSGRDNGSDDTADSDDKSNSGGSIDGKAPRGKNAKSKKAKTGTKTGSVANKKLTINCDFTYRDDLTHIYYFDAKDPQPSRGQNVLQFNPTVEYQMYKNLAIRLYFEYQYNKPYTPGSYATTNMSAGTVVRYMFNQ